MMSSTYYRQSRQPSNEVSNESGGRFAHELKRPVQCWFENSVSHTFLLNILEFRDWISFIEVFHTSYISWINDELAGYTTTYRWILWFTEPEPVRSIFVRLENKLSTSEYLGRLECWICGRIGVTQRSFVYCLIIKYIVRTTDNWFENMFVGQEEDEIKVVVEKQ